MNPYILRFINFFVKAPNLANFLYHLDEGLHCENDYIEKFSE